MAEITVAYTDPDNGSQLGVDGNGWYWFRTKDGEWVKAENVSFSVDEQTGEPSLVVVW